jgi:DNA mismatch repair protein MutS2
MEFDPQSGRPTFRLVPGPPGASEALALARRLGLPGAWLDRAEALLGSEHRDLRRLIAEVERIRQELAETRDELATEVADAAKLRRRLADEEAGLAEERKGLARKLRSELDDFRRETAEKLRREVDRLAERFAAGRRKGLAAEAVEALFATAPTFGATEEAPSGPVGPIVLGGTVRHLGLGWQGTLDKLEDGRAEVVVRGKRVRCRRDELAPAGGEAEPGRKLRPAGPPRAAASDLDEAAALPPEINLIGLRVEPALEELDAYLDRALLAAQSEVRVIHGHGSGRLRDAVRSHLRAHRGVAQVRAGAPNEGGNGATVVTFRGA